MMDSLKEYIEVNLIKDELQNEEGLEMHHMNINITKGMRKIFLICLI